MVKRRNLGLSVTLAEKIRKTINKLKLELASQALK